MELKLFSPLMSFEHELQSMLDRAFGRVGAPAELMVRPSMDVTHEEGVLRVELELPGMAADDVDIWIDDDVLVVSGEKQKSRKVEKERCYVSERTFGRFERRVMLPDGFDIDRISAHFEDGVLRIEVPVTVVEATEARHIPVTTH